MIRRVLLVLLAMAMTSLGPVAAASLARTFTWESILLGDDDHRLVWPVAVAVRSSSELAVADAEGHRLLIFTGVGTSWQVDRAVVLPSAPVAVTTDGQRYLVALRGDGGVVSVDQGAMAAVPRALPEGVVPGALASLPGGDLLVFDHGDARILAVDGAGRTVTEVPVGRHVTALAASPNGSFLAAVAEDGRILRFDANARPDGEWSLPADGVTPAWPVGLGVLGSGRVAVVDRHNSRLVVLDAQGKAVGLVSRHGREPGLLHQPSALAVLADGRVLVADQGNARAQIFRPSPGS